MSDDSEMAFSDKAKLWYRQHAPSTKKRPIVKAPYKMEDRGPYSGDMRGHPTYTWWYGSLLVWVCYMAYYFWYVFGQPAQLIDYATQEMFFVLALASSFGVSVMSAFVVVQFANIGGEYRRFFNLTVRSKDGERLWREEFRVKTFVQIWNPKNQKGVWRSTAEHEKILEAEGEELAQKEAEAKKKLEDQKRRIERLSEQIQREIDPKLKKMGARFDSVREIMGAAATLTDMDAPRERDIIREVVELRRQFIETAQKINLGYYVTILHCEGDVYPLVISDAPLFGGGADGEYAEFFEHDLKVRSWVWDVAAQVRNACVGDAVHLTDYTFYIMPTIQEQASLEKAEEIRWAPILYITGSDRKAIEAGETYLHGEEKSEGPPDYQDVIQTQVVYESTVADQLFERYKLVTSMQHKENKTKDEIEREYEAKYKELLASGLDHVRKTGKAGQQGITNKIVAMFSAGGMKVLLWMILVCGGIFLGTIALYHFYGVPLPWDPGNSTGGETTLGIIKSLVGGWL